jgi:hypothetical protein
LNGSLNAGVGRPDQFDDFVGVLTHCGFLVVGEGHLPNMASINSTALVASPIVLPNLLADLSSSTVKELLVVRAGFFGSTLGAAVFGLVSHQLSC